MTPRPRELVDDLLGLVLPVECAGCAAPDVRWCADCAGLLAGPAWRCEERAARLDRLDGTTLPVWTLAEGAGALREAVIAWKDRGRRDLAAVFARALRTAARRAAPLVASSAVVVVAVPSTGAARRRRGANLVDALARAVAEGLAAGGRPATAVDALRRRPGADQVGLGAQARARNLAGRVRVRRAVLGQLSGADVVLVDDLLTTGASLAACRLALEAAGARVVAAFTLGATPRPGAATGAAGAESSSGTLRDGQSPTRARGAGT